MSFPAADTKLPVNFGLIVFPGFQALDAFGPLDALNILSETHNIQLSIISCGDTLTPVSTKTEGNPLSSCAQSIVPTHTVSDPPSNLDVLLVPGGKGTRSDELMRPIIAYVAAVYPSLRYLITVCTGSTVAARAGVLDGRKATTNKKSWQWATSQGPKVDWVKRARWVVDGNIYTSSGVSAGIDCMLQLMEDVYGEEVAQNVSNVMEYVRNKDPSVDVFADLYDL